MNESPQTKPQERKPGTGSIIAFIGLALAIALVGPCVVRRIEGPQQHDRDARVGGERHEAVTNKNAPVGSAALVHYGTSSQSAEQDLTDLSHAFDTFSLLLKGSDPLPLGANEDIGNALRGRNRTHLRFLPDDAPCFNAQGQIVDRWQTPMFFHAIDHARLDIRSAGPDKKMWTGDDIHRRYDGQFVKGAALNAPSLFEATKDYHSR